MYNIITLEVTQDHTQTRQIKMFGQKCTIRIEMKAGDTFTVNHYIDEDTQNLIDEGKLKVIKELITQ